MRIVYTPILALLVVGSFTCSQAEVNVLKPEQYEESMTDSQGIIFAQENRLGILPIRLTGYGKELPKPSNFTNATKAISAQLALLTTNPAESLPLPPPDKIGRKKIDTESLARWIHENFASSGIRTVFYLKLKINRGNAPIVERLHGIPVGFSQNRSMIWVTATPVLQATLFDADLAIPVAQIESSIPYVGGDISAYVRGGLPHLLRDKLAEDTDRMILAVAADLAAECRVNRLLLQRPHILLSKTTSKEVTLAAGSNIGIHEDSTFLLFGQVAETWMNYGKLRVSEVGPMATLCRRRGYRGKEKLLPDSVFAIPAQTNSMSIQETSGRGRSSKIW